MFVYKRFPGDNDTVLMDIQDRLYSVVLGVVFEYPRKRYLEGSRLLLADTELAKRLAAMNSFDHRTLQETHDLIAARFRSSRTISAQQTLFETHVEHEQRIELEWRSFFR